MLRTVPTARLAFQHSPEREQRLLLLAQDNTTTGQSGGLESPEQEQSAEKEKFDPVAAITQETRNDALVSVPEGMANVPDKPALFDLVITSGSVELNETLKKLAHAKEINLDRVNAEAKIDLLHQLLREPKNALAVAQITENRLRRYEELTREVEKKLTLIAKQDGAEGVRDIEQLKAFAKKLKITPPEDREALRQKILGALGLENELESREDQAMAVDILVLMNDTLKAEFKRQTFMNPDQDAGETPEKLRTAREKHLDSVRSQYEGTKEFLESSLQAEAQNVYNAYALKHDEHAEKSNEQMFKDTGMTAIGFIEAFDESTLVAFNIKRRSTDDASLNLPERSDENYLRGVQRILQDLQRANNQLKPAIHAPDDRNAPANEPVWLRDKRLNEERNELLAYQIGGEIDKLKGNFFEDAASGKPAAAKAMQHLTGLEKTFGSFGHNRSSEPSIEDRTKMRLMPFGKLQNTLDGLYTLERTPDMFERMGTAETHRAHGAELNIEANRLKLRQRLGALLPQMFEHLTHGVCRVLDVKSQIEARETKILGSLKAAENPKNEAFAGDWVAHAETEIGELEKATKLLNEVYDDSIINRLSGEAYAATGADPRSEGFYDDDSGKIYVNVDRCADEAAVAAVIEHERGHAVIDILSRKTNVCPNIFSGLHRRLVEQARSQGIGLQDLMERQSEKWNCKRGDKINEEDFLDELTVRYADWKFGRTENAGEDELSLFRLFEESKPTSSTTEESAIDLSGKRRYKTTDEGEVSADGQPKEAVRNHRSQLQQIEAAIKRFDSFFTVYPERLADPGVRDWRATLLRLYEEAKAHFEKGDDLSTYEPLIDDVMNMVEVMNKEITRLDMERMDLTNATASQKVGWRKIMGSTEWMSIYDMMAMFKDAGEDIQRMWKRRGESVRSSVGKKLFGLIPRDVPYIGQLSREFQGREQASEQEEVSVWEKRYDKIDSHRLLHEILPKSKRKDELKGIINLLTKRGRMDWNFELLWNVLEEMSEYHMPHDACKRDILLRDMYLQKLSANIWKDKDLFEHWKNDNDSGIKSGKSRHQATVDTLSGTKGGLQGKLKYLLEKQILLNKDHHALSAEEEINPHLFEAILHYSMRNGKMPLEDKIFYLIQGVAHGMLNIDRMKALLGEQGEILNSFPFIDFFNGKTAADVMRMAALLGYRDLTGPLTKPDFRTSDFIIDEIANDEGAKARAQKALKNVQNIDHEDLPGLITMMDHQGITEIVGVYSGSQPKISPEGRNNIYVGYNSLLQYYAIRAKMHKEKGFPFNNTDLKKLAIALAAYAHYDNLVTGAATEGPRRPQLSFTQIEETKPVSDTQGFKTKNYRDTANNFLFDLVNKTHIPNAGGVDITKYLGKGRNEETKSKLMEEDTKSNFKATEVFVKQLENAILENKTDVINMLASMAEKKPRSGGFIAENEGYTYENVSKAIASHSHSGADKPGAPLVGH